jgi:hypothetical protein
MTPILAESVGWAGQHRILIDQACCLGVTVRKVFVSYARANKRDVDQLVLHLGVLGCQTWVDSLLHGGQDWWEEVLQRIAACDVFLPVISDAALNSVACGREFEWADALGKPVLPVALEPTSKALPRRVARRQIIDYSEPEHRDRAALKLAGGLGTLPPAPPLPLPLPAPPAPPLSYLTDLVDLVSQPNALDHEQQRLVLLQLEPALRSVDSEERQGGHAVLGRLQSRDDLYADVYQTINRLSRLDDQPASSTKTDSGDFETREAAESRCADSRSLVPGPLRDSWGIAATGSGEGSSDEPARTFCTRGAQLDEEENYVGAAAAYQQAIDTGHPEYAPLAAACLGVVRQMRQDDSAGAEAAFQIAINSGHAEWAPRALNSLGVLREHRLNDFSGAERAYEQATYFGNPEVAPMAATNLGELRRNQLNDVAGAEAAYQVAVDSGHVEWTPTASKQLAELREKQKRD